MPRDPGGALYVASDIGRRLASAVIVYGTVADPGANRYAAEQLQKKYLDRFESEVPIRKDFEVTDDELHTHDIVFVGRPDSNSALAAWAEKIGVEMPGEMFRIAGREHASAGEGLVFAAANPLDHHRMVLVLAGNNALQTVLLSKVNLTRNEYSVFESGTEIASGFLK